jgi:hypothetical protein
MRSDGPGRQESFLAIWRAFGGQPGDPEIRQWALRNKVELCFTPTYASWANPIEAHFRPLRTFVIAGSDHQNHTALGRHLHRYLRWRNANARHPDVLAAQRRERARGERQHRWGHPTTKAASRSAQKVRWARRGH